MIIRIDQTSRARLPADSQPNRRGDRARGTRSIRQAAQRTRAGKRPGRESAHGEQSLRRATRRGIPDDARPSGRRDRRFPTRRLARASSSRRREIEEALYRLALEHRAQGGSCKSFLAIASEQAKRVFDAAVSDTSTEGA